MLPPHELKNKNFTHAIRGYDPVEVDEHVSFIIEKYTELYRENDALETKIRELDAQLEKYRTDEESIRGALVEAQRASGQIVDEANARADTILRSAKINCDRIISEFKSAVSEERDELLLLRGMVKKFKKELFLAYQTHIEFIEKIAPELDSLDESEFSDEAVIRLAVESIKSDILSGETGSDVPEEEITVTVSDGETAETDDASAGPDAADAVSEQTASDGDSVTAFAQADVPAEDAGIPSDRETVPIDAAADDAGSEDIPDEAAYTAAEEEANGSDEFLHDGSEALGAIREEINIGMPSDEAVEVITVISDDDPPSIPTFSSEQAQTDDADSDGDEEYLDFLNDITSAPLFGNKKKNNKRR